MRECERARVCVPHAMRASVSCVIEVTVYHAFYAVSRY